ncbi:hypothetical protein [Xenorhabdus bovienii]|uniref:hypothetical protein n=1 Tax=Xenorhabdus bovienii TaxID=40576 RepID=UPI003DA540DE
MPDGGLSLEGFSTVFGTPGAGQLPNTEDDYLGHVTVNYTGAGGKPDFPPRVAYTETAEFNKASLKAFEGIMSPDEREKELENAGWQSVPVPLQDNGGFNVWVGRQGYTDFAGAEGFYRPLAQRQTLMTGKNLIGWDTHFCAVIREQSATGSFLPSTPYAEYFNGQI